MSFDSVDAVTHADIRAMLELIRSQSETIQSLRRDLAAERNKHFNDFISGHGPLPSPGLIDKLIEVGGLKPIVGNDPGDETKDA